MKNIFSNKIINYFLIALSFFVLAIIFTYPLILNFSHAVSGWSSMNDSQLFLWNFWWVKYAIFHIGKNPFYTSYLYYPNEVNLTLHTLTLFPALISLIFQAFTKNIVIVYNIMFLLTFTLSAFGTYLLVKYIYKNKFVAYIAAVAFAFCPYIFAHAYAGHFNLINTWTLPFYLYFLLRIFDEKKILNVFLASLIAIFQVYTDFHYLFFMFIISAFVFVYYLIVDKKNIWLNIKNSFFLVFIILIFAIPIIVPTYRFSKVYTQYQNQRENYSPAVDYTDLTHYFPGPDYENKLLVSDTKRDAIEKNFVGGIRENNIFLGYTLMTLAILAIFFVKDKRKWLFLAIALVFLLISFGSSLRYNHIELTSMHPPAYYLAKYVFKNSDLVYGRFVIVTELMVILLACGFLSYFQEKFKTTSKIILPLVLLLIIAEYINIPIALTEYNQEDILAQISKESEEFRIITLPNSLYIQTMVEKPQLAGGLGRRAHDYYMDEGDYKDIPGIRLFYSIGNSSVVPNDDDTNRLVTTEEFQKYNVRYVILEKTNTPESEIIKYRQIAEEVLGLSIYYENEDIVVYKVL